jgi:leader peptidase (prepilin peptidase)/N-methyltransferase
VEALTIAVGLLVLWQLGPTWAGLSAFLLGLLLITVTFTDLECLLIPDRVTVPGILAGLATRVYPEPWSVVGGVAGCLLAGSVFYVIALASRGGMGGGDVKLAAMIGAFLGWQLVLVAIFVSVVAGVLVGLALLGLGLKGRKDPIPFGPFLALGGLVTAVWGRAFLDWYLG